MTFKAVLFDLDGTLVDARVQAWALFQETSLEFNLGINSQEEFFQLSERNFFTGLVEHCKDESAAAAATQHYMDVVRERYNPPFIPGIFDVISELAEHATLAILSSNMHDTIRRILESGGVTQYFSYIFAGDHEPSKAIAIEKFLAGTSAGPAHDSSVAPRLVRYVPSEVGMVTDTVGDVGEARASGIRVCGVIWGMHSEAKLRAAGADHVARTPQELVEWFNQTHGALAAGA